MVSLLLCMAWLQAGDPHSAYKSKSYDQALQGFLDMQVSHPDDAALMMNVGSTYYQLKDYPQAEKAFAQALAAAGDNVALRQAAAYDLGNTAYHQGKLDEAVQRYRESLALNGNDVDARHNLQLAEAEMQKRRQEAQKQQEQREQQKQKEDAEQKPGEQKPGEQKPGDEAQQPKAGQDKPGDPSDNSKQPSDASKEPGEQKPSQAGDKPDESKQAGDEKHGDEKHGGDKAGDDKHGGDKAGKPGPALSPEQAERYLQSVGETRPKRRLRGKQVQRMPNGKDW